MAPNNPNVLWPNLDLFVLTAVYANIAELNGKVVGLFILGISRVAWWRDDGPFPERPYVVHSFDNHGNLFGGIYDLTREEMTEALKGS